MLTCDSDITKILIIILPHMRAPANMEWVNVGRLLCFSTAVKNCLSPIHRYLAHMHMGRELPVHIIISLICLWMICRICMATALIIYLSPVITTVMVLTVST